MDSTDHDALPAMLFVSRSGKTYADLRPDRREVRG